MLTVPEQVVLPSAWLVISSFSSTRLEVNSPTISSRISSSATSPRMSPYSSTTMPKRFFCR